MASGYSFTSSSRIRASRFFFVALCVIVVASAAIWGRRHLGVRPTPVPLAVNETPHAAVLDLKPAPLMTGTVPQPFQSTTPMPGRPAQAAGPAATPSPTPAPHAPAPVVAPASPLPSGAPDQLLVDAKAKSAAGDLVAARDLLNPPLVGNRLTEAQAQSFRDALMEINQKLVFSAKRYANDPFEEAIAVQPGLRLQKVANQYDLTWPLLCRINGYEPTDAGARRIRAGQTLKAVKGPFFAVVTKSAFRMDLYLGGLPGSANCTYVTSFPVGLGRDDSTPAGLWTVELHNKLRNPTYYSPHGEGIIRADDPKNPLGGFWIGIKGEDGAAVGKTSYGIHGTIDPDSIGRQASMGCIRLRHDDIALVYDMLVEVKSQVIVQ